MKSLCTCTASNCVFFFARIARYCLAYPPIHILLYGQITWRRIQFGKRQLDKRTAKLLFYRIYVQNTHVLNKFPKHLGTIHYLVDVVDWLQSKHSLVDKTMVLLKYLVEWYPQKFPPSQRHFFHTVLL